jgi:hypothetical protein
MEAGLLSSGVSTVPKPYCDCQCPPLAPVMLLAIRTASSLDSDADPYPDTLARLAAQAFGALAQADNIQAAAFCTTYYQTQPNSGANPLPLSLYENTATSAPVASSDPDGTSATRLGVTAQDFEYQWAVPLPAPWVGNGTITVSWRECTAHYDAQINAQADPLGDVSNYTVGFENASISYVDKSETLTPSAGATSVQGAVYTVLAAALSPGDTVTVTGPKEVGQFLTGDAYPSLCGLNVQSVATSVEKSGFLPYLRADPQSPAQTLYAVETAANAPGYLGPDYSGYQEVDSGLQTGAAANGDAVDTFSGNVPAALQSAPEPDTLGYCNLDLFPAQAQSVAATTVTFKSGLVLTLSQPITTDALLATAHAQLAAPMAAETAATGGVLALRYQPANEVSYAAKQCRYQPFLNVPVLAGIAGLNAPLATQDCPFVVAVDQVTTNLDTGESTLTTLTFNFDIPAPTTNGPSGGASELGGNQGDTILAGGMLTLAWTPVPVPGSNQRITWSNARAVGTCDRISWGAQAVVS